MCPEVPSEHQAHRAALGSWSALRARSHPFSPPLITANIEPCLHRPFGEWGDAICLLQGCRLPQGCEVSRGKIRVFGLSDPHEDTEHRLVSPTPALTSI